MILVSSGAIAVGRPPSWPLRPPPSARGKAGRRRHRADPPGPRLSGGARPPRHHRRANPADPRRHRGAPPAPQRARHLCPAAGARRGSGGQRERHRRHRRDPLWRQRPARRPRRPDDQRRHAGAALRHRRALHRRSAQGPRTRDIFRWSARSARRSRRWPATPPPGYSSGGMVTKLAAARIAMSAGCHMLIAQGQSTAGPPLAAIEAGARATLFLPRGEPRSARKAWIAGAVNPRGIADRRRRCGRRIAARQEPAAGRRRRGRRAFSSAATAVIIRTRSGTEAGRGLSAYSSSRHPPHRRPQEW